MAHQVINDGTGEHRDPEQRAGSVAVLPFSRRQCLPWLHARLREFGEVNAARRAFDRVSLAVAAFWAVHVGAYNTPIWQRRAGASHRAGHCIVPHSQQVGELYGRVTPIASISWIWPPQILKMCIAGMSKGF
jgi:hypothetical protein